MAGSRRPENAVDPAGRDRRLAARGPSHARRAPCRPRPHPGVPRSEGTLELIVRRPAVDEREVLDVASSISPRPARDTWKDRRAPPPSTAPAPRHAAERDERPGRAPARRGSGPLGLAGDHCTSISTSAPTPAGARARDRQAVIEVTDQPTEAAPSSPSVRVDALRFVNSEVGSALRLRGLNARWSCPAPSGWATPSPRSTPEGRDPSCYARRSMFDRSSRPPGWSRRRRASLGTRGGEPEPEREHVRVVHRRAPRRWASVHNAPHRGHLVRGDRHPCAGQQHARRHRPGPVPPPRHETAHIGPRIPSLTTTTSCRARPAAPAPGP